MRVFYPYWRKTIFTRLLALYFIILIPIYMFGYAFFQWGGNVVRNNIIGSMSYQTDYFLNNFVLEINRMRLMASELINDDDLNLLAAAGSRMNEIDKMFSIRRLQARLTSIRDNSRYIQDVSVIIPQISRIVSAYNGHRHIINSIDQTEYVNLTETLTANNSQLFMLSGGLALGIAHPFSSLATGKAPLFIILIELSITELADALHQMNAEDGGVCFLYDDRSNRILASGAVKILPDSFIKPSAGLQREQVYRVDGKRYLLVSSASNELGVSIIKGISEDQVFKPLGKYQIMFWVFTLLVIIIIAAFSAYSYRLMHKVYQNAILRQTAELKQLQAQINPHFLYNSFLTLNTMIRMEEYDDLESFTKLLGDYFQYITRNASDDVFLFLEAEHARGYCKIQSSRFAGRINVIFEDLPEDCRKIPVPRLIMQPILENAFTHGLEDKVSDGLLTVRFHNGQDVLSIIIEDNGENFQSETLLAIQNALKDNSANIETTALLNISRRLMLRFGGDSGVKVQRGLMGGCEVTIAIPKKGTAENNV